MHKHVHIDIRTDINKNFKVHVDFCKRALANFQMATIRIPAIPVPDFAAIPRQRGCPLQNQIATIMPAVVTPTLSN